MRVHTWPIGDGWYRQRSNRFDIIWYGDNVSQWTSVAGMSPSDVTKLKNRLEKARKEGSNSVGDTAHELK